MEHITTWGYKKIEKNEEALLNSNWRGTEHLLLISVILERLQQISHLSYTIYFLFPLSPIILFTFLAASVVADY